MGREEHLIGSRSHPFQPEQQQEGGALILDLFRWGWGREGWGEKAGGGVKERVGMSGTFTLLRTCLPWVAVAGGGILEGSIIVIFSTFSE